MAQRTSKPGVYKITNKVNGKFYIGSSSRNVHQRWNDHLSQMRTKIHPNIHLQRSFNKHGEIGFMFEVLEYCINVLEREQYYMDTLKPHYNIEVVAGNSAGVKRREETCKKIGLSKVGNKNKTGLEVTSDVRKAISETLKEGYRTGRIVHPLLGTKGNETQREAVRKSAIGNTRRRDNPVYRGFIQLDKDTLQYIQRFETAREARIALGFGEEKKAIQSKIIKVCRNGNVAYGYRWKFENVQVKSDELLEKPEEVNQQPS